MNNQHKINRWKHLANKNSKANFKIVYKPWFLTYGWPRLFFCNLGMITLYLGKKQSFSSLVTLVTKRIVSSLGTCFIKPRTEKIISLSSGGFFGLAVKPAGLKTAWRNYYYRIGKSFFTAEYVFYRVAPSREK